MTRLDWNDPTKYHWRLTNRSTLGAWMQWVLSPPADERRGPVRRALRAAGGIGLLAVILVLDLWLNVVGATAMILYGSAKATATRPDAEGKFFWLMVGVLVFVPLSFGLLHLWNRRNGATSRQPWHRDSHSVTLVAAAFAAAAFLIASPRLPFRGGFTGPVESWRAWVGFYTDMTLNTALFGLPQAVVGKMTDLAPASTAAKGAVFVFKGLVILLFINRLKKTLTGFAAAAETDRVCTVQELHAHLAALPLGASNPVVERIGVVAPVDEPPTRAWDWLNQYQDHARVQTFGT